MTAQAFRYVDGKLVPCDNYGPRMMLRPPVPPLRFRALPQPRVDVGIMSADLEREARLPGGPPVWFNPNASRRKRWAAWSRASRKMRERLAPEPVWQPSQIQAYDGHRFTDGKGGGALLYLPVGERPTKQQERDVAHAFYSLARDRFARCGSCGERVLFGACATCGCCPDCCDERDRLVRR